MNQLQNPPSRVAFISTMAGSCWGGSEELWNRAAMRLAANGHRVGASVCHWDPPPGQLAALAAAGVDVFTRRLIYPRFWQVALARCLRRGRPDPTTATAVRWLEEQRPDIVCISQGGIDDGLEWMSHCRRLGFPYVAVVQANAEWLWPDDNQAGDMARAYESARRCLFVSRRNQELLEDQIGRPLPNAALAHNPFHVRWDAQPEWPEHDSVWKLACVARLDPKCKGQDLLLRVLGSEKWKARNLRVNFYGSGRCERNVHALTTRFGVRSVEFKGHVADVEGIWRENHALILPSRLEGTPLALIEAMLCSRMGIVTDVGGNAELVEHGTSGFVISAPTAPLIDEALESAWSRRAEWKQMGVNARSRAASLVPSDPVAAFCEALLDFPKQ